MRLGLAPAMRLYLGYSCRACGATSDDEQRTAWREDVLLFGATAAVCTVCNAPPEDQQEGKYARWQKRKEKRA